MNIDFSKKLRVPYYLQIKEGIKAMITRREMKAGEQLPTEFGLSKDLGISRLVVNRAYRELVTEGLLIRKRARGTFVATPAKRSYMVTGPLYSMTETLSADALEPSNQILLQEVITASDEVSKELKLPEEAQVIHLRNLRLSKQMPFSLEEMYLPYDRFPALVELDLNNCSIYDTLEKTYDAHPQEALDLITAGLASAYEGKLLGVNKGAALMRLNRTSTDRWGQPVEYRKVAFNSNRYHFVARMQRIV